MSLSPGGASVPAATAATSATQLTASDPAVTGVTEAMTPTEGASSPKAAVAAAAATTTTITATSVADSTEKSISPLADSESAGDGKLYSGVFALNKPAGISSAQALRDLQTAFNKSRMFAASIKAAQDAAEAGIGAGGQHRGGKPAWKRRQTARRKAENVKLGHGGTLDPMATGVLIVGVYGGTKELASFLGCSKEYITTLLFGAASDTYDVKGRVLGRAPYEHVSRAAVAAALPQFRGAIKQRPPIYSALHMDGKRLYEYAREGKPLPREIEQRDTHVDRLEIVDWLEPGTHSYAWPQEDAPPEEKQLANTALHLTDQVSGATLEAGGGPSSLASSSAAAVQQTDTEDAIAEGGAAKRKRNDDDDKTSTMTTVNTAGEDIVSSASAGAAATAPSEAPAVKKPKAETGEPTPTTTSTAASTSTSTIPKGSPGPAVRLDMSVASGFYVRSLCHDLGQAVGSLGMMATLVRTRQAGFALGGGNNARINHGGDASNDAANTTTNNSSGGGSGSNQNENSKEKYASVLEYADLARGEAVWAPQVQAMLERWNAGAVPR